MKISTIGGKPLISGSKVVVTSGNPCACGDCGGRPIPTPPCCPSATLLCDQISASSSSCGFAAFDGSGRKFLTKTRISSGTTTFAALGSTVTWSSTKVSVIDPDTCAQSCSSCSGSASCHTDIPPCDSTKTASCTGIGVCSVFSAPGVLEDSSGCFWTPSAGCSTAACFGCFPYTATTTVSSATESVTTYSRNDSGIFISATAIETLSDETATNDCNDAIADLPAYSGDFEIYFCEAARNSTDGGCFIERFRYKFTFAEPLAEDCMIKWIERTFDADGNPVSVEEMSETVSAGETESSIHEATEPDSNGTKTVIYPVGPCCIDGNCMITDETTCTDGGGEYQGDSCAPNPCSPNPCT